VRSSSTRKAARAKAQLPRAEAQLPRDKAQLPRGLPSGAQAWSRSCAGRPSKAPRQGGSRAAKPEGAAPLAPAFCLRAGGVRWSHRPPTAAIDTALRWGLGMSRRPGVPAPFPTTLTSRAAALLEPRTPFLKKHGGLRACAPRNNARSPSAGQITSH